MYVKPYFVDKIHGNHTYKKDTYMDKWHVLVTPPSPETMVFTVESEKSIKKTSKTSCYLSMYVCMYADFHRYLSCFPAQTYKHTCWCINSKTTQISLYVSETTVNTMQKRFTYTENRGFQETLMYPFFNFWMYPFVGRKFMDVPIFWFLSVCILYVFIDANRVPENQNIRINVKMLSTVPIYYWNLF